MKRSRIKSKRTRPRPPKDAGLYARYSEQNPCSEFARWLGVTFENRKGKYVRIPLNIGYWLDENWRYMDGRQARLEKHHLWSIGQRPDLWSNLIRLTDDEHKWADKNKPAGRVLALAAKLRKLKYQPQEPGEFTIAEIDSAAGKRVIGIVAAYSFHELFFLTLQAEVVAGLESLEREARAA